MRPAQNAIYTARPALRTLAEQTTIDDSLLDERKQLRHTLRCKSFDWYLNEVYPELLHELQSAPSSDHKADKTEL